MEILGYAGALLVGIILGLFGGGGSMLGIPIMVYILGISPTLASSYSLFIVGTTATFGAFQKALQGLTHLKIGLLFGAPCITMSYLTRLVILPELPEILFSFSDFSISKDVLIMILFASLIFYAGFSMIKGRKGMVRKVNKKSKRDIVKVIFLGTLIGFLTTLVGSGGGGLIVPSLVLLLGMQMKKAVGTSLLIVCGKSLIGFVGDLQNNVQLDWTFLLTFVGIAVIGIFIGNIFSKYVDSDKLKKAFGIFIVVLAIYILTKEIFF